MLSVVTCDAPVTPEVWRGMFKRGAVNSFNQARPAGAGAAPAACMAGRAAAQRATGMLAGRDRANVSQWQAGKGLYLVPLAPPRPRPPRCRLQWMATPPPTTPSSAWPAAQRAARVRGRGPGRVTQAGGQPCSPWQPLPGSLCVRPCQQYILLCSWVDLCGGSCTRGRPVLHTAAACPPPAVISDPASPEAQKLEAALTALLQVRARPPCAGAGFGMVVQMPGAGSVAQAQARGSIAAPGLHSIGWG